MDISSLDTRKSSDAGASMQVRHPGTGDPLTQDDKSPITITLAGVDSEEYQRNFRRVANERLKRASDQKKTRQQLATAEEIEAEQLDLNVRCTLGWSGIIVDGETVPFSPDAARMVYQRFPWLREQVDEFIGDRANFLKPSKTI